MAGVQNAGLDSHTNHTQEQKKARTSFETRAFVQDGLLSATLLVGYKRGYKIEK